MLFIARQSYSLLKYVGHLSSDLYVDGESSDELGRQRRRPLHWQNVHQSGHLECYHGLLQAESNRGRSGQIS